MAYILASALFWALLNVLDSMLVRKFEIHPVVLMWSQTIISVCVLLFFPFFFSLDTPWLGWLLLGGLVAYAGDVMFFVVLRCLDVSVSNAAWAILALLLSVFAFLFLGERWSALQSLGALCVLGGVTMLSFWHQHVSFPRTLSLLVLQAILFVPYYVVQKLALDDGQSFVAVLFWPLVARESLSTVMPLLLPAFPPRIRSLLRRPDALALFTLNTLVILCFFVGTFLVIKAYEAGPLSLVVITADIQPFLVIAVAAFFVRFFPRIAPRELLTTRSIAVKLLSFSSVFLGLALLALSQ